MDFVILSKHKVSILVHLQIFSILINCEILFFLLLSGKSRPLPNTAFLLYENEINCKSRMAFSTLLPKYKVAMGVTYIF